MLWLLAVYPVCCRLSGTSQFGIFYPCSKEYDCFFNGQWCKVWLCYYKTAISDSVCILELLLARYFSSDILWHFYFTICKVVIVMFLRYWCLQSRDHNSPFGNWQLSCIKDEVKHKLTSHIQPRFWMLLNVLCLHSVDLCLLILVALEVISSKCWL